MRIVSAYMVAAVALCSSARADFITVRGWISTEAITSSATGASVGSLSLGTCSKGTSACTPANADVTFTTTGVDFEPPGLGSGTISGFINSNAFPINNLVYSSPGVASMNLSPTIWEFVGNISVTGAPGSPQSFTFSHDDGVTFIVNGQTVINAPGPTGPANTTGSYTGGANANAPFTLIYAECCFGSAVLKVSLLGPGSAPPSSVPEPSSTLLLGTGLAVAACGLKKRLAR